MIMSNSAASEIEIIIKAQLATMWMIKEQTGWFKAVLEELHSAAAFFICVHKSRQVTPFLTA